MLGLSHLLYIPNIRSSTNSPPLAAEPEEIKKRVANNVKPKILAIMAAQSFQLFPFEPNKPHHACIHHEPSSRLSGDQSTAI